MKIAVKVKTRTSQNKIVKNPDGTYTAYLTAPPVKGGANKSLIRLLSQRFDVAKSYIQIIKGGTSGNKIISIGE